MNSLDSTAVNSCHIFWWKLSIFLQKTIGGGLSWAFWVLDRTHSTCQVWRKSLRWHADNLPGPLVDRLLSASIFKGYRCLVHRRWQMAAGQRPTHPKFRSFSSKHKSLLKSIRSVRLNWKGNKEVHFPIGKPRHEGFKLEGKPPSYKMA